MVIAGMVLAPSFMALVLVLGLRALFASFQLRVELIDIAMDLATVLVLVRFVVHAISVSLGPNSWFRAWELKLTFVLWAAISFQVLGWFSGLERTLDDIDLIPGQEQVQPVVAAQGHRGHRRLPGRHQPDRTHHRTARHEARGPRDLDAHRHLEVLDLRTGRRSASCWASMPRAST